MNQDIPGYQILREIGKGGMGVVYRAKRDSDDADVAIKVLPPTLITPTTAKRFRREGQALMAIDHPNVVKVYEVNCHEGVHYIAMEFVNGHPLSRQIRNHPEGVPFELGLRYAIHVGRALSVIHDRGMIHRDLKPGNVMVIEETGVAKLLDFGLVQVEGLTMLTATGSILGTPLYMSPEQCSGSALDLRSDVYAYGVLLFHLLTGSPPFQSTSAYELLQMQQNEVPPAPEQLRPDLPHTLSQIILRCMEKEPADRFRGLAPVLEELEKLAEDLGLDVDQDVATNQTATTSKKAKRGPRRRRGLPKVSFKQVGWLAAAGILGIAGFHPKLEEHRSELLSEVTTHWDEFWQPTAHADEPEDVRENLNESVADQFELARRASVRWNEGRKLESSGQLTIAYDKYREAARLYARGPYLKKLIDLAPRLGREGEVRRLVEDSLRLNPKIDPDGSLQRYLGGSR
ncbi:MAG: serine/threonine-protein kinase [Planctomycetota bacterium]